MQGRSTACLRPAKLRHHNPSLADKSASSSYFIDKTTNEFFPGRSRLLPDVRVSAFSYMHSALAMGPQHRTNSL
jgi:hypothetical protein